MDDTRSPATELDQADADELARVAVRTSYYDVLSEFVTEQLGEQVPEAEVRAFERDDGITVLAITDSTDHTELPRIGFTFVFEEDEVLRAMAEYNPTDEKTTMIFPNECFPVGDAPTQVGHPDPDQPGIDVETREDVTLYRIGRR